MTNRSGLQKIHFQNYLKPSNANNPSFVSNLVNDSLTLFAKQKNEQKMETSNKALGRCSEYKSRLEPLKDSSNLLSGAQLVSHNYAKYSKDVSEKSKSILSQYGSNLLSPGITNRI